MDIRAKSTGILCAVAAAVLAAGASSALQAQDGPADPDAMQRMMEERNRLPNTPGDGPFPAVIEEYDSLPGHVVYRPADLSPFFGGKLPVLAWGNGGCVDDGTAHRFHLAQIASYGYLVIAAGHWRSGPGAPYEPAPQRIPTDGTLPPPATSADDVLAGIDWALEQDGEAGSPLYGRVATDKLAVAGHSCGGLQAIEVAADPRIDTVLIHNSGIYNNENSPIQSVTVSKDMLSNFHQPVIYIMGGPSDIAYPNGTDDFARVDHVPIMLADLPVGHGGTFGQPMGGAVAHVAVDWLEWQLRGDEVARTFLHGRELSPVFGHRMDVGEKGVVRLRALALGACFSALCPAPAYALAAAESGALYDGPAPGSQHWSEPRLVTECYGSVSIYNTKQPRYDLYLPDADVASGAAVLMLPGGGLRVLGAGEDTDAAIAAFLDRGVAVMHLEYRTRQLPAETINTECLPPDPDAPPIRFPAMQIVNGNANPAPGDPTTQEVLGLATADAQTAFSMLHARAGELGLDAERIGVIGTSAGGGVAFGTMLADAPPETKPDFFISIFGPSLQDVHVPEPAPPLYLVTEADHGPVTDGLLAVFSIWKAADEKVELHVYEVPNFSMTVDLWGPRLFDWMVERGILPENAEQE